MEIFLKIRRLPQRFNKFFPLKNIKHCFRILKAIKAFFFIIRKTFGLLGLYVIVKGIISSLLVVFGCIKTSRGISLALNFLASISDLNYFCSSNVSSSSLKRFSLIFSFLIMTHILLARKSGIFFKQ